MRVTSDDPSGRHPGGDTANAIRHWLGGRSLVLIGLMGAGKTTVGRRLAQRLDLPFVDSDQEIETAAGLSIPEIFEAHGEDAFRDGEKRVIARLLHNGPQVLATGGGAYMADETREEIRGHGISIWLKADIEVLMERVGRRGNRPLLKRENPRKVMEDLMAARYPVYADADMTVKSADGSHDRVVDMIVDELGRRANGSDDRENGASK